MGISAELACQATGWISIGSAGLATGPGELGLGEARDFEAIDEVADDAGGEVSVLTNDDLCLRVFGVRRFQERV